MISDRNWYIPLLLLSLLQQTLLFGADILTGNAASTNNTFSFPILAHDSTVEGLEFFTGATTAGQAAEFAVAKLVDSSSVFIPIAPEMVSLNGKPGQSNPLFNAGIKYLKVLERVGSNRVAVVTTAAASNVYVIERVINPADVSVLQALNIKDASGSLTTAGIVGIGGGLDSTVFAAVIGNGGTNFGDPGSGIAVVDVKDEAQKDNKTRRILQQRDVGPGAPAQEDDTRAASLDRTSSAIKIGSDVTALGNIVTIHWDSVLGVLYVALQVTSASTASTDGGRAIVVGSFDTEGTLSFNPIAPDAVFTAGANNEIVGGLSDGVTPAQIAIYDIKTMHSSMALPYLIIQGGNVTSPDTTHNTVYALPLVDKRDNQKFLNPADAAVQGTLAQKNSVPTPILSSQPVPRLLMRAFVIPAATSADILTSSDSAAMVGGGPLLAGDITDMIVLGDTVFVSVGIPAMNQAPGIFYSQALFDATGNIKGWTQWLRAGGTIDNVFGFALNNRLGNFTFMTGADSTTVTTVERTNWASNDIQLRGELPGLISTVLPQTRGGIRFLQEFLPNAPGIADISLTVATGLQALTLIQTGQVTNGVLIPTEGNFIANSIAFDNGTVSQTLPGGASPLFISMVGGALDELGPITAAEIVQFGSNGWLFVGGIGGLALLSQANGNGWTVPGQLGINFLGLMSGMSFKTIGNYSFIRKLIYDNNFLYVLTDTRFDRIDLSGSNFATGQIAITTLATMANLSSMVGNNGTFLDVLVSEKMALLATSVGVFRVGNGADISTAVDFSSARWIQVSIPYQQIPVIEFVAVSTTGRAQDVARAGGGNIWFVSSYYGKDRGQINRFSIADTSVQAINSNSLQPLPDFILLVPYDNGMPTFFVNFGQTRSAIAEDGTILLNSRDRDLEQPPFVYNKVRADRTVIPLSGINIAGDITRMFRSIASGSWFIAGDLGLRLNE